MTLKIYGKGFCDHDFLLSWSFHKSGWTQLVFEVYTNIKGPFPQGSNYHTCTLRDLGMSFGILQIRWFWTCDFGVTESVIEAESLKVSLVCGFYDQSIQTYVVMKIAKKVFRTK